ncbi:hypothetical protein Leryth_010613, partial [Lithospermum erythrorhizon]
PSPPSLQHPIKVQTSLHKVQTLLHKVQNFVYQSSSLLNLHCYSAVAISVLVIVSFLCNSTMFIGLFILHQ